MNKLTDEQWNSKRADLKFFFENITLPKYPVRLNETVVITDVDKFITSHLSVIENRNKEAQQSYMDRLILLKHIICFTDESTATDQGTTSSFSNSVEAFNNRPADPKEDRKAEPEDRKDRTPAKDTKQNTQRTTLFD